MTEREGAHECRLAYGLHRAPGFHCWRQGGQSVCGACAGDVLPLDSGVRDDERRPLEVETNEACG